jgi:predicted secreted protein
MIQVKKSAQDLLQNFKTTRSPSQVKVNKSKLLEQSCLHSQRGRKLANQHVLEFERSLKYAAQSERHC